MTRAARRTATALGLALGVPGLLAAKTVQVPREFATIRSAVQTARPGDTIEVGDGIYLETNIIVDKNLRIRARRPFGAVIYGEGKPEESIFIVRAVAAVEGFILKNSGRGILLRGSPEASLTGRDLAFLNMEAEAVSVNDVSSNYGKARLTNVIVDRAQTAFSTNDAHTLEVRYALIANCGTAFSGYDHIRFFAEKVILWNCGTVKSESDAVPAPPATNTVLLGGRVLTADPAALDGMERSDPMRRLNSLVEGIRGGRASDAIVLRTMEGFGFLETGEIYFKVGEPRRALPFFRNALSIGSAHGLGEIVWRAQFGLARAFEGQGAAAEALDAYRASVAAVEAEASSLPARPNQSRFLLDKRDLYESAVRFLAGLAAKDPAGEFGREALLLSERSRGRAFLGLLSAFSAASVWTALGPDLTDRARSIDLELSRTQVRLRDAALGDAERAGVLEELDRLELRFEGLMSEIRLSRPEFMGPAAAPEDPVEIGAAVRDGATALCEYFVGKEGSFLFTLTPAGLAVDRLPPRDELAGLVRNYLKYLTLQKSEPFPAVPGGKRLYDLLVGPARARLEPRVRRLVIIPDDVLWELPFEALVCGGDAEGARPGRRGKPPRARFLVEDLEVAYAPSALGLAHILDRPRSGPRSMDLLAVANPKALLDRGLSSNERLDLADLTFVEDEADAIRAFFPKGRTAALVGGDATDSAFLRSPLAAFRVVHLAAHAVFDDRNWWRSAMLLRPDPASGGDGLLQLREIYLIRLAADLVVLSGCHTAMGERGQADGATGLVSGFLHAGARSVLSSLWSVEDESSSLFMKTLYAALARGASTGEALRTAKIALLDSEFAHPFHWAAYVLTGDASAGLD